MNIKEQLYHINHSSKRLLFVCLVALLLFGCARMGNPDGGWYDETPPEVIGASPNDKAINVNAKKIRIMFNEYIKVENPTENIIISPHPDFSRSPYTHRLDPHTITI